jgi:hypothetical protein
MAKFYVKDKYRTNPLSLQPGGHTVSVEYENGDVLRYDKIKSPKTYVRTIEYDEVRGKVVNVIVDGEILENW